MDESNDTRRFVGAVAARSKVARAVDSSKCPPAATAARRAVVFGDEIAVHSIGGRRLDVVVSTQNVGPEDNDDDLTLAATVSKRDTTLRIELACAAPAQPAFPAADAARRPPDAAGRSAAAAVGLGSPDDRARRRRAVWLRDARRGERRCFCWTMIRWSRRRRRGCLNAGFVCADARRGRAAPARSSRPRGLPAAVRHGLGRSGACPWPPCAGAEPTRKPTFGSAALSDGGREILDFVRLRGTVRAHLVRRRGGRRRGAEAAAALAPPPPVAPPPRRRRRAPKDDDSATTTTMDESTVDTRLKGDGPHPRRGAPAAYEGRGDRRKPRRAVSASSRPSSRPTRPRRRRGPSPRRRRRRRRPPRPRRRGPTPAPPAPAEKPCPGNTPQPRGAEHSADRRRAGAAASPRRRRAAARTSPASHRRRRPAFPRRPKGGCAHRRDVAKSSRRL